MTMVKKLACTPSARFINNCRPIMSYSQYQREAMGMTLAMKTGTLFANVKSARWKAQESDISRGASSRVGHSVHLRGSADDVQAVRVTRVAGSTRVARADAGCAQCGQCNVAGVVHGDSFFCAACWPLMGLGSAAQEESAAPGATEAAPGPALPGSSKEMSCTDCGARTAFGEWGVDSLWYCAACWEKWQGASHWRASCSDGGADAPTDVGTDHTDIETGTEGTVIGSDCVSCSDVWSDYEA
mmetsp:Transcript_118650/g.360943  ORF Transcript_118650/g.360943 Transcript_118650/m.360943 type:complete len:242 (-) Transcript_118650:28-753(-)